MKLTESSEFWVWGQLLPGFSPQWQAPLSLRLATGLVLCGVRHWARREGPLWPGGLGIASRGRRLEPDSGVALPTRVQRGSRGCPSVMGTVPSAGT